MSFQEALMKLPNGKYVLRHINSLTAEELSYDFFCPHCHARVYPVISQIVQNYFSARGTAPHKKGCIRHHTELCRKIAHLDYTGNNVNLESFLHLTANDHHPPFPPKPPNDPPLDPPSENDEDDLIELRVKRVTTHPRSLLELYGILKTSKLGNYAGHRITDILVDSSTIHFHRRHTINHFALVVCSRCYPPAEIHLLLKDSYLANRCLCLRVPYKCVGNAKELYFILQFQNNTKLSHAYESMKMWSDTTKRNNTKKFLAYAKWTPFLSTDQFDAYIGSFLSTGTFRPLYPQHDHDPK